MRAAPALSVVFLFLLALAPTPARARITPCVPGVPAQLQQAGQLLGLKRVGVGDEELGRE